MTIGNITSALFPPDWNTNSAMTVAAVGLITAVALGVIANNRNKHIIAIENTDNKLTIIVTGRREGVPQKLIDEANAAIEVWRKNWSEKLLSEEDIEHVTFSAEKRFHENQHTFTLNAERVDKLDTMQQAIELRFLEKVTFQEIPKKQKAGRSSTGSIRGKSLPIRRRTSATT